MAGETFSDEILMAYADGELDPETARSLEKALAADAALSERLSLFTGTRDALRHAARERPLEPIPDGLMARVKATIESSAARDDANVIPLRDHRTRAGEVVERGRWQPVALAASLALAIGLGAGFGVQWLATGGTGSSLDIALLDAPGLETALSRMPSGERRRLGTGEISIIASFRNAEGEFCREFEYDNSGGATVVSVVCHDGTAWDTRLAIATAAQDGTSYAPASSLDTLEAYLTAIGAGPALDAEDEKAAMAETTR